MQANQIQDYRPKHAERQAAKASDFAVRLAHARGFAVSALIATSGFDSWGDCVARWGYTGDAYGYWQEALLEAARVLKSRASQIERRVAIHEHAERNGGEVCTRCGGYGGHSSWPGFVCYDCGGRGWV